jgi:hypothetical protein
MAAAAALKRPFCGSGDVRFHGASNGKRRRACNNPERSHKTFHAECRCNGRKPDVKKAIIKRAVGGAGIPAAARGPGASADTEIKELKKERG